MDIGMRGFSSWWHEITTDPDPSALHGDAAIDALEALFTEPFAETVTAA